MKNRINSWFAFSLGIIMIVSYTLVFSFNVQSLGSQSQYSWPNLTYNSLDLNNPRTEMETRLKSGFEIYLKGRLPSLVNSSSGLVIGSGSGEDVNGHTRNQLRMALVCLALSSQNQTYRTIANSLLRSSYALFQERTPAAGSRSFGNFYWYLIDGFVDDLNAGPFNSIVLAYIFHYFKNLLDPDVVQMWEEGMAAVIATCVHRLSSPSYTNIQLLRTAGVLILSQYFGDSTGIELGMQMFREWKSFTLNQGLTEYTTINYLQVSLKALMAIWEFAPTESFSNEVTPFLEFMWSTYLIQENNGNMGGPHARDYSNDFFWGGDIRRYINHYFGKVYPNDEIESDWLPLCNWKPSDKLKSLVNNRTYPYNVEHAFENILASSYFTESYSLGGQGGVNEGEEIGTQTIPLYATLNTSQSGVDVGNRRNSLFFKDYNSYRNLRTTHVQSNNSLTMGFHFDPSGLDQSEEIGVLGFLGNSSAIHEFSLNGTDTTINRTARVSLGSKTSICYSIGDIFIAIQPWSTGSLELLVYSKTLDPNDELEDAREDELMLNIRGLNAFSGVNIFMDSKEHWSNFTQFSLNFHQSSKIVDSYSGNKRIINSTIHNTTLTVISDLSSSIILSRQVNQSDAGGKWVYKSPWITVEFQDVDYNTPFIENNEYCPYFPIIILVAITFLLSLIKIRKSMNPIFKEKMVETDVIVSKSATKNILLSKSNNNHKIPPIIQMMYICLLIINIIVLLLDLYTVAFVLVSTILQLALFSLLLGYQLYQSSEELKYRSKKIFAFFFFRLFISIVMINLLIFLIGILISLQFSWTIMIIYILSHCLIGLGIIFSFPRITGQKHPGEIDEIEVQNKQSKLKRKSVKIFKFINCLLGLIYITYSVLLAVDESDLEMLFVGLYCFHIIWICFILIQNYRISRR
jgi:hypothetical protein